MFFWRKTNIWQTSEGCLAGLSRPAPLVFIIMHKLKNLIQELEYSELKEIKEDLDREISEIKKTLEKNIAEKRPFKESRCIICQKKVDPSDEQSCSLNFDQRSRKAEFCSYDCLEYFLIKLRSMKD